MSEHRWSGWPGAWCLDCGAEDEIEVCTAVHDASLRCVLGHWYCTAHDSLPCSVHYNRPCPCPGEGNADPYLLADRRRDLIYLLVRRLGDVLESQECPADYFGLDVEPVELVCKCGHSEEWHELTPDSDPPRFDCILGACSCRDFDLDEDEIPELTAEQIKRAHPHWELVVARAFIKWIGRFK